MFAQDPLAGPGAAWVWIWLGHLSGGADRPHSVRAAPRTGVPTVNRRTAATSRALLLPPGSPTDDVAQGQQA